MLITDPVAKLPSVAELESHLSWLLAETRATRDYLRTAKRVEKWRADRPILTRIEEVEAERAQAQAQVIAGAAAEVARVRKAELAEAMAREVEPQDDPAYGDDDEFL